MTTAFDALRYQRALEGWRALAEGRLEHMTQLYESGRWRRYFSEEKFLSVIRETKAAADAWRRIAPQETPAAAAQVIAMPSIDSAFVRTQPPPSPFATIEAQRSVA
ncbi:TIGR03809 family protein [Bradyrhizobium sp. LHD-71]|uniref:TIGR03809 family protein n=1 Tax=Bradyrhizobium sp. LHD-71 TaxID=3072141 RepID=UPI0028107445|nr:TIGR03809 family protein [Bradyrhizobium sp. LHD-71]MDQ8732586.1 TIGR03809 family protein [Bradyrhizobium sp. LHD-71]